MASKLSKHSFCEYSEEDVYVYSKDAILNIVKSNDNSLIHKYVEDYVILLQTKIEQYTTELLTQPLLSCPAIFVQIELLDQRLKEFVRLHHLDLTRTINYQINRFKDTIYDQHLFQQVSSFHLTTEQVLVKHFIKI